MSLLHNTIFSNNCHSALFIQRICPSLNLVICLCSECFRIVKMSFLQCWYESKCIHVPSIVATRWNRLKIQKKGMGKGEKERERDSESEYEKSRERERENELSMSGAAASDSLSLLSFTLSSSFLPPYSLDAWVCRQKLSKRERERERTLKSRFLRLESNQALSLSLLTQACT